MDAPINNKPLFAAYLNMARNNCHIALSHIAEKTHKDGGINEDAMHNCAVIGILQADKRPDESRRIVELIDQHFPFAKLFIHNRINPAPADYALLLINFIFQLNQLRNFYTHHTHKPYTTDEKIMGQLQFLFDVSRRKVRQRFSLHQDDVKHLVRKTTKIINGERTAVEKENYPYAFADKNGSFTEKGLAFFICLFLEKKYGYLFLKQLRGFKNSSTKQTKATLEAYCFFHIKVPQPKLQSTNTDISYLLDVLEELKRCPDELYSHLSETDKKSFISIDEADQDEEQPENILKRYNDRFPYFALRYLELTNALGGLQFYYDLGKYYFKVYEKAVDGEMRLRRLHKDMRGFGRLADFKVENMPEPWPQLSKRTDELAENYAEPYIAYTIPHYHIVNNQIGLCLGPKQIPSLSSPLGSPEPDMWLSIYELPALIFYHLLTKGDNKIKSAKEVLSTHCKAIRLLFSNIKDKKLVPGYERESLAAELKSRNLDTDQVPSVLLEYLLGQSPSISAIQKAQSRLKELKNETELLKNKIDIDIQRSKEKVGSKVYRPIKTGKIADFLARDMLLFQPPIDKIKGKATSTLFQVLQARLAFYGRDKHLLHNLYKECNLMDSKNPHPFLNELSITDSLIEYYRNYLFKREAYLDKCLKKCMQGKIGSPELHFLHLGEREKRNGADYYIKLAEKFLTMPINLPRGIFMDALIRHFKQAENEAFKNLVKTDRVNTSFLLQEYLTKILSDNTQNFYNLKRTYRVFNNYYDNRKPNSRDGLSELYFNVPQLSLESEKIKAAILKTKDPEVKENVHRNYKYYTENEKQIRKAKTCDIVLFLILRDLFPSLESSVFKGLAINQIRLADILPNAETGILSQQIEIKLPLHGKFIVQRNIKLKNYGDFRRFLKDRRLESLLPYFEEEYIDRAKIERELEDYDTARVLMHSMVLEFERQVVVKNKLDYASPESGVINFEEILNSFFQNNDTNIKREQMMNLRNKFSHNQYPDFSIFNEVIKSNTKDISIAKKFIEIAEQLFLP